MAQARCCNQYKDTNLKAIAWVGFGRNVRMVGEKLGGKKLFLLNFEGAGCVYISD